MPEISGSKRLQTSTWPDIGDLFEIGNEQCVDESLPSGDLLRPCDFTPSEQVLLGDFYTVGDPGQFSNELKAIEKSNSERIQLWARQTFLTFVIFDDSKGFEGLESAIIRKKMMGEDTPLNNLYAGIIELAYLNDFDISAFGTHINNLQKIDDDQMLLHSGLQTFSNPSRSEMLGSVLNYLYIEKEYPLPQRVLVVGPGLNYPLKDHPQEPPQVYEPFAVLNKLVGLGQALDDMEIDVVDVNPVVIGYLKDLKKQAEKGIGYQVAMDVNDIIFPIEMSAYRFMRNISSDRWAVPEEGFFAKAVISPEAVLRLSPYVRDIITRAPGAEATYDLVIMNEVLSYFEAPERMLATLNLKHILKPGGFIIHSEPFPTDVEPFKTTDRLKPLLFAAFDNFRAYYPRYVHVKAEGEIEADTMWLIPTPWGFVRHFCRLGNVKKIMEANIKALATPYKEKIQM